MSDDTQQQSTEQIDAPAAVEPTENVEAEPATIPDQDEREQPEE